jgi:hypothetical protein
MAEKLSRSRRRLTFLVPAAVIVFLLEEAADPTGRRRRGIRGSEGGSVAKKTNKTIETDQEVALFRQAETERTEGQGSQDLGQSAHDGQLCSG